MYLLAVDTEYGYNVPLILNRSNEYEEGKVGRKKEWHTFETATKLLKSKPECLNMLMEASIAAKSYKDRIAAISSSIKA